MSGHLESSRHPVLAVDALEGARGSMRDILGSLKNAERLLRSVRVGPKALSSVVPLLHASCGPLRDCWRLVEAGLAARFPDSIPALGEFVIPRIDELEAALSAALSGPLNAKQRLGLEKVVVRAAADLDSARALMDLLQDALGGPPAVVDLWELTRETFQARDEQSDESGETHIATLEAGESVELSVHPRVAMALIAIGVKLVAVDHPGVPHVAICRMLGRECGVVITRGAGAGDALLLRLPRLIPPTLECARAATAATRGRLEVAEDRSRVSLIWSAAGE
jgi:hypothetical protein